MIVMEQRKELSTVTPPAKKAFRLCFRLVEREMNFKLANRREWNLLLRGIIV